VHEDASINNPINWVDPDILAYEGEASTLNLPAELEFKNFFTNEWPTAKWDYLRERWDPLITDEDPHGRLLGKTALWNLTRLHELQRRSGSRV
jgi:hypothetical protein